MDTQKAIEGIVQGTSEAWRVSCGQKIIGTRDELLVRQCADVAIAVLGLPTHGGDRMKTLDEFQNEIGAWGNATFPMSTSNSVVEHLAEEVVEFFDAWRVGADEQEEEAADCLLLLLHYAYKNGFSLYEAAEAKMAKNRARRWKTTPEPAGHFKHEPGT